MSVNRITGMATGMDTDEMVKKLVSRERTKVDRQEQYKTLATWKKEKYNNISKDMANFLVNSRKELGLSQSIGRNTINTSYKNVDYIKKASTSNDKLATATATSDANFQNFDIEIKALAQGANKTVNISAGERLGMDFQMDLNVGGKVHRISLNGEAGGEVTYQQLAEKINSMNIGVKASYALDTYGKGVFNLTTDETGAAATLSGQVITGGSNNFRLGMAGSSVGTNAVVNFQGVDLEYDSNSIEIQGVKLDLKGTTPAGEKLNVKVEKNTDEIFDKIKKFVDDYNNILDSVGKEISTPRKKANSKTHEYYMPLSQEEKKALSDDDVKEWEENARTGLLYRDRVLSGVFSNTRGDLYKNFTNNLSGESTNSYNHLTNIGISTVRYSKGAQGGKLQIDEARLKEALDRDPEQVMELLFAEGEKAEEDTTINGTRYRKGEMITETQGIFTRIFDGFTEGLKDVVTQAGPGENGDLLREVDSKMLVDFATKGGKSGQGGVSDLDFEILNYEKKIQTLTDLLYEREDYYYNKFARMESIVQKMQNQSDSMAAQLMGQG